MGRILGLIPARGGSKGVPRKNIRDLGGRPLLDWTLRVARAEPRLTDVMVSTEDREIAEIAKALGAWVPFLRSPAAATDAAKSLDVVLECLDRLEDMGKTYEAVCLLQPTTPFRSERLLAACLDTFLDNDFTGLISVERVPAHYHPNWTFLPGLTEGELVPAQGKGSVVTRRQDLPPAYIRDGAIYVTRVETLRAGSFFGSRLGYLENTDPRRVNIDTPEDFQRAETLAAEM